MGLEFVLFVINHYFKPPLRTSDELKRMLHDCDFSRSLSKILISALALTQDDIGKTSSFSSRYSILGVASNLGVAAIFRVMKLGASATIFIRRQHTRFTHRSLSFLPLNDFS